MTRLNGLRETTYPFPRIIRNRFGDPSDEVAAGVGEAAAIHRKETLQ